MAKRVFNEYKIAGKVLYIYIVNRKGRRFTVIADSDDLDRLLGLGHRWYVKEQDNDTFYAYCTIYEKGTNGKKKYFTYAMHQFLMNIPYNNKFAIVDHINNNRLDNRKKNLRLTSDLYNTKNRGKINNNNTSGYRNVTRMGGFWRIQLQINKNNYLFPEKFTDVHESGKFAKKMRKYYYKDFSGK